MAIVKSSIDSIQMTTYATLHLSKGTKIRVQNLSLRTWSEGIEIYPEQLPKKIADAMKQINESDGFDICEAKEDGWIQISKERPVTILEVDSEIVYAIMTSYLCSETDVLPTPFGVSNDISSQCESGRVWECFDNPSRKKIFLEYDGGLIESILEPGQSLNIRKGYWFAMEGGIKMKTIPLGVCVKNKSDSPKRVWIKSYKERW